VPAVAEPRSPKRQRSAAPAREDKASRRSLRSGRRFVPAESGACPLISRSSQPPGRRLSHFVQQILSGDLTTIALEGTQCRSVPLLTVGRTGVDRADHPKTTIRSIPHRVIYALVREEARHDNGVELHVAQQILKDRGVEEARRGLWQHDLVGRWRDLITGLRFQASRCEVKAGLLVVQTAVSSIRSEALNYRMNDFQLCGPGCAEQAYHVGHGHVLGAAKEVGPGICCAGMENPLLYIDQQQGDRKSTRLNSSHVKISYAVFCLKKKKKHRTRSRPER